MSINDRTPSIAFLCDEKGIITCVISDDLQPTPSLTVGQSIIQFVDRACLGKALNLIVELRARQVIYDWEMNVSLANTLVTLQFAGSAVDKQFLIVASQSSASTRQMIAELMQINNEQANALRAAVKEQNELTKAITEQKDHYNEISRLNNELVSMQRQLAQKNADLERSNHELEQFAYLVSHDLQEPLRMMTSYTQLLAKRYRGKLDADADEFIAFALDGASRMKQQITDLLAFSRVGTRGKEMTKVDSASALDRALLYLRPAIEEYCAIVTHDALPIVRADEGQLIQLFQNLIGNAIKYHGDAPPQVQVTAIEICDANKNIPVWQFSIRDNGIGFEQANAEKIFEVFRRLHTQQEYVGTGIGLAICKKIIQRHGGRIWAEAQLGQGATFYFTLPGV